jgi:hypothetical protein
VKFAVIPTNGRDCLDQCLQAIVDQVDEIILIDTTGGVPPWLPYNIVIDDTAPINISRWWNWGLNMAAEIAATRSSYEVAIINDDVIVPPGWFDAVATGLRKFDCAAACSGGYPGVSDSVLLNPVAVPLETRMQGFAFMLAGEKGLRANEDLHWYFTDDYIDWESRKLGGMNMIGGYPVEHLYPNGQLTPHLARQVARDAQTFVDIYGRRPW